MHILIFIQILICAFMTGLVWTIQILHYPAFDFVDENKFQKFHAFHSRRITFLVLPAMIIELVTAGLLVFLYSENRMFWINAVGVILIWLCTFLFSVPLHNLLAKKKDPVLIRRLTLTNWPRTALWTLRLALLLQIYLSTTQAN